MLSGNKQRHEQMSRSRSPAPLLIQTQSRATNEPYPNAELQVFGAFETIAANPALLDCDTDKSKISAIRKGCNSRSVWSLHLFTACGSCTHWSSKGSPNVKCRRLDSRFFSHRCKFRWQAHFYIAVIQQQPITSHATIFSVQNPELEALMPWPSSHKKPIFR